MNHKTAARSFHTNETDEPLMGLASLSAMAYSKIDLAPLGKRLIERARRNPNDSNALMDLSTILQLKGDRKTALAAQAEALKVQRLYRLPAAVEPVGIRLLAIMGPGDVAANTPIEFLIEGSDIRLDMMYVTAESPFPSTVPDHDLVFVAVAECDENQALLERIERVLRNWPRPVLNAPSRIACLYRDRTCRLLKSMRGVAMPISARIGRQTLDQIGTGGLPITAILEGGEFPVIVRPVDSHGGHGLMKIDQPAAIAEYLEKVPESDHYLSRFVNYQGKDGFYRKYRIAMIEGRPFACHMAISRHWMVHYLSADMEESAEKRAEEARFMATFDEDFARRHGQALRSISDRLGLDYFSIDCSETPDGRLLIFEADSSALVHAMDPVDVFPYKRPQVYKIFRAFREMLINAMKRGRPRNDLYPGAGDDNEIPPVREHES